MQTTTQWSLIFAIASFALIICGLAVAVLFAYKLRGVMRRQALSLKSVAEDVHQACLGIADLTQQLRLLSDLGNPLQGGPFGYGTAADIVLSPTETYEKLDQNWGSVNDVDGRRQSSCIIDGDRRRTAVVVVVGQSNAANHGTGKYVARHQVDNFNLYDGKCYHAQDPLLGASGDGGNFATRLGDKLIDAGLFDRVILAPIAMGGTTVEQWAEEGMFNRRIPAVIRRLHDAGLSTDLVLWQQGEGNQGVGDIGGRQYRKNLLEVIRTFRRCGVAAPFFVSLTTTCGGPHPNAENIRAGQKSVVNPMAAIYQGADTDTIGLEHRWDTCHFNEVGLDMVASLWLEVISTYCHSAQQVVAPSSGSSGLGLVVGG